VSGSPEVLALAAARAYLARGWQPVPIYPPRLGNERTGKKPVGLAWQKRRFAEPELAGAFTFGRNVGLAQGTMSGGLADVDLDCPEAIALAPEILPPTPMKHGRASARLSHWWYAVTDTENRRVSRGLVELRGGGSQTVVPPSLHYSGERLAWAGPLEPAEITWRELAAAVDRLALAAALVQAGWDRAQAVAFARDEARDWKRCPPKVLTCARRWGLAPAGAGAVGAKRRSSAAPSAERSAFTDAVLAACDVDRALVLLGLEPTVNGRRVCPIHAGARDPTSFSTQGGDGSLWYCHSDCGRGGDAIQLVAELRGLDRIEARRWLAEQLGVTDPRDTPPSTPPPPRSGPRAPVSHADRAAFHTRALTIPGHAAIDRSPPGVGKTFALAEVLLETNAVPNAPRTLVTVGDHDSAEAFERVVREASARTGRRLPTLARVPAQACEPGVGREEEYKRAASRGWNPVKAVCIDCPHEPARARRSGESACTWRVEQAAAWDANVTIAQKTHLALSGFWAADARGENFSRVVIEEDPSGTLVVSHELDRQDLEAFMYLLSKTSTAALEDAQHDARHANEKDAERMKAKASRVAFACDAANEITHGLWKVLDQGEGFLEVPDVTHHARSLLEGEASLGALELDLVRTARAMARERRGTLPRNLLPAVEHVAREQLEGRRVVVSVARAGALKILRLDVRRPIPADRSVLVLDATGDRELLEADLGRSVEVLEAGTDQAVHVVQLTDSLWSRKRLGLDVAGEGSPARELEKVADAIAALIQRTRAVSVGIVSHRPLLAPDTGAPLLRMLEARLPRQPRWGPNGEQVRLRLDVLWFGAQRGRNDFKGHELVVVLGTPTPPAWEVQRRALRLGAPREELGDAPQMVEVDGRRRWSYRSSAMARAHAAVAGAELAQAIGRGARGDVAPRAGVWVFSSMDLEGLVSVPVERTTLAEVCLDPDGVDAWPRIARVLGAGAVGRDRLVADARASERLARRALAAWPRWCVLGAPASSAQPLVALGDKVGHDLDVSHKDVSLGSVQALAHPCLESIRADLGFGVRQLARALSVASPTLRRWLQGVYPTPPEVLERAQALVAEEHRRVDVEERAAIEADCPDDPTALREFAAAEAALAGGPMADPGEALRQIGWLAGELRGILARQQQRRLATRAPPLKPVA
jgi:hypothetical protein